MRLSEEMVFREEENKSPRCHVQEARGSEERRRREPGRRRGGHMAPALAFALKETGRNHGKVWSRGLKATHRKSSRIILAALWGLRCR